MGRLPVGGQARRESAIQPIRMSDFLSVWGAVSTRVQQEQNHTRIQIMFPVMRFRWRRRSENGPLPKSRVSPWCSRYTESQSCKLQRGWANGRGATIGDNSWAENIEGVVSSPSLFFDVIGQGGSALWSQPLSAKRPACPAGTAGAPGWWCSSPNFVWGNNGRRNSLPKRFEIFRGQRLGLSEQHRKQEAKLLWFYLYLSSLPRHSDSRAWPSFGNTASSRERLQLRSMYHRTTFSSASFSSRPCLTKHQKNIPTASLFPMFQREFRPR